MKVEIENRPCNTAVKVSLDQGESLTSESGSMIAMDSNLSIETTTYKKGQKGILKSIKRMFAGESFFLNHYTANSPGELWLSSQLPGDMIHLNLSGSNLIVQSSSFVAAAENVEMNVGWQGFKSILSGEGLFWLKMSGHGDLILNSFGAIYEVDVEDEYVVDTGHIVAFDESLQFNISKAGSSWLSSFIGGEGFVCRFKGRGKVYCQSHNPTEFGYKLRPYLKQKVR
jgi:uncharacterized protein (TIGR00266 family)